MDRDALVHEIGRLLVHDGALAGQGWDAYALVASYADGARRLSGFGYRGDEPPQPATPTAAAVGERIDALREATRIDGRPPWQACVFRLVRANGKLDVEFEYDAPERWEIRPDTLAEVAARARPA